MKRSLMKTHGSLISIIPTGIIEHFNLKPGDKLDFRIEKEHIIAMPIHIEKKE